MTRTPIRALSMAIVTALTAGLLSTTLTPAFAEDINTDPTVVVDDSNTPVDESTETTDETVDGNNDGSQSGTPVEVLMYMGAPEFKVFKSLTKKSIQTARNLAPKQSKSFHKTPAYAKWYAKQHIAQRYNWNKKQFGYLAKLWGKESAWKFRALGARNYYVGIPQLNKKAILANGYSIKQFRKNPEIQVQLGAKYIKSRYGTA
ncbi:MAG: hypothetical protein RLZZ330_692, partial [Actinomycetota bacterium]